MRFSVSGCALFSTIVGGALVASVARVRDSQDVRDRAFRYACAVARAALAIEDRRGAQPIARQLLRAGTSVGANLEEARAASSKREFGRYSEISIREARESIYWLRLCVELQLGPVETLRTLAAEGDQIRRILTTIVMNAKEGN